MPFEKKHAQLQPFKRLDSKLGGMRHFKSRPTELKIAVLGTRGIPAKHGGVERHCEELYTRLAHKGHDITVFTRSKYTEGFAGRYKGVKLKPLPTFYTKHLETIVHTFNASLASLLGDYDVVHFHGLGPASLCWIPRLKPGTKVVSTCHRLEWRCAKWGKLAKLYLKLGERSSVAFSHGIICVSSHLCRYFKDKYGKRTACIPNGVSAPESAPRLDGLLDLKKRGISFSSDASCRKRAFTIL